MSKDEPVSPWHDARPVTALPNLGPAMAELLSTAGFQTIGALNDAGADKAYRAMIAAGHRPHFMAYLALVLALQRRAWTDASKNEKQRLRKDFDRLVEAARPANAARSSLAAELDKLGIRLD